MPPEIPALATPVTKPSSSVSTISSPIGSDVSKRFGCARIQIWTCGGTSGPYFMETPESRFDSGIAPFGKEPSRHFAALLSGNFQPKLLDGVSSPARDEVLAAAVLRRFPNVSVVIHQGDPADRLFLLLKGSARFFFITPEGRKVYLLWLTPGDIFGAASLLSRPTRFLVSTEVTKGSQALVWPRPTIKRLAARHPQLLENSLSVACDYLVWYLASHLSLICHNARQRLAHVLLSLSEGIGQRTSSGIRLEITNEQLANTANITLFTASRLLNEWQRIGAVTKRRGLVWLHRPQELFHKTEDD
jgi:CRP/FNR family transcriptional regulator, nitrogen oxide reductase regulator